MNYSNIPVIRKIYNKLKSYDERINELNNELSLSCIENLNLRYRLKRIHGEKINVVFVCWRPAVWGSLKTVYESMKADNAFDVKIVTIPNKKQLPKVGINHDIYSSEGGEDFWKGDDVISGYNYETKEWLDLKSLKADYICFQQPYNVCRTYTEKSWVINKYAKLFYVAYYTFFNCNEDNYINEECTPLDFMKDLSFYFTQNEEDQTFMKERMQKANNSFAKVIKTGFPRFDNLNKSFDIGLTAWKKKEESRFRIIWTPRWCTNENNCHFFDYKDKLVNYCKNQKDIDFVLRPHPQMFLNFNSTGEFLENKANEYKRIYEENDNLSIDTLEEFIPTFYTASCMITDTSSVVPEFFLTGKPVIYCHKKGSINSFSRDKGYTTGFYWVENWNELKTTLDMLRNGDDPLKQKRQELIKDHFYIPKEGAGYLIKEAIKQDFLNA